jgi:hypothetical protein
VIVEILDPPFAHARQVRMFERYRCAHHGLPRQVGEAGFGRAQEAFGHVQPSVFGQIDELFYQVAPRGRALGDQRHQRGFFRASTLAKASLRMALQSGHVYHSCRNRHCPLCQTRAKEAWVAARRREVLPVPYFHLVFTLPHDLNGLIAAAPRSLHETLFSAVSATLTEFAANPRHLGGVSAFLLVLHNVEAGSRPTCPSACAGTSRPEAPEAGYLPQQKKKRMERKGNLPCC